MLSEVGELGSLTLSNPSAAWDKLTEWKQNFTDVSSAIKNKMHELGVRGCLKNTVAYATEGALSLAALAAGIEFYEGAIGAIGALKSMSGGVLTTADGIQVFIGQVATKTLTKTSAVAALALFQDGQQQGPENSNKLKQSNKTQSKNVKDLIDTAKFSNETRTRTKVYEKPGTYEDALRDFESLNLKNVRNCSSPRRLMKLGELENGKTVGVRSNSTLDGRATLELIQNEKSIKIRYNGWGK